MEFSCRCHSTTGGITIVQRSFPLGYGLLILLTSFLEDFISTSDSGATVMAGMEEGSGNARWTQGNFKLKLPNQCDRIMLAFYDVQAGAHNPGYGLLVQGRNAFLLVLLDC